MAGTIVSIIDVLVQVTVTTDPPIVDVSVIGQRDVMVSVTTDSTVDKLVYDLTKNFRVKELRSRVRITREEFGLNICANNGQILTYRWLSHLAQ